MKIIKILIALVVLSAGVFGCTKAIIDEGETTPITETIKYDPEVQEIMFNHCITCHGGAAPAAGLTLTNYPDVRFATENGTLADRINNASNPMPPSGLLSAENRQIIEKWIEDGYLED